LWFNFNQDSFGLICDINERPFSNILNKKTNFLAMQIIANFQNIVGVGGAILWLA
jgi:hypothetical protein